jgi:hypothetical protein
MVGMQAREWVEQSEETPNQVRLGTWFGISSVEPDML